MVLLQNVAAQKVNAKRQRYSTYDWSKRKRQISFNVQNVKVAKRKYTKT
jgi:hypothetical protein